MSPPEDQMPLEPPAPTPQQASFADVGCFACAPAERNPDGLNLVFEETADGARTRFSLPASFESYPGYLHGGIVSAVLDETMGYVGVFKERTLPFTRHLEVTFRYGVRGGHRYECVARLVAATETGYRASASIRDAGGRDLVLATAEFARPTKRMAERMLPGAAERFAEYFRE